MSTICISADWHVSNFGPSRDGPITRRGQDVLAVVSRMYQMAREQGADLHIGLGDIFDLDRPPPALLRRLQEVVETTPTWLLVGNHDQTSEAPGHHALAPMEPVTNVVEDLAQFVHGRSAVALVGFRQRDQVVQRVQSIRWPSGAAFRVLGVHLGVADQSTPEFLRDTRDSIYSETLAEIAHAQGVTHVFAGNWHNPAQWTIAGVEIWQVGGLSPHCHDPIDRPVQYGRVLLFDTTTGQVTPRWVPGPRYHTVGGPPPWNVQADPLAAPLWLRYQVEHQHAAAAREDGARYTAPGCVRVDTTDDRSYSADFGVVPKAQSAREAALTAAYALGGSPLVDYVNECLTRSTQQ